MQYISHYRSPLGGMLLAADEQGLTGLWFEGQKYFALHLIDGETEEREIPLFGEVKRWLDIYFSGQEPDFKVPLHLQGTAFQREVWEILCGIPYGKTVTYGETGEIYRYLRKRLHMHPRGHLPVLWAVLWDTIRFLSLCPATGSSGRMEA